MARPYQKANIPGPEMGTSVTDPTVMANLLKSPMKKVLVIGAESLNWELDGKKLVDFLNLKKIVLCGHSLGGPIAQEYFFRYSDEVVALILIGTGARLRVSPLILNTIKSNFQEFLDRFVGFLLFFVQL